MHVLVAWLKQSSVGFRKIVDGTPVVVIENGDWNQRRMHLLRLQEQDIMAVARAQGIERMEQIKDVSSNATVPCRSYAKTSRTPRIRRRPETAGTPLLRLRKPLD